MFWDNYCKLCFKINKKPNSVAKEIGISSATVTKWKNGSQPSSPTLKKIANYFNVPSDILLQEDSEVQTSTQFLQSDMPVIDKSMYNTYTALLKSFNTNEVKKLSSLSRDQADEVVKLVDSFLKNQ